jgi:nuclear cap-binding protein subunit 1
VLELPPKIPYFASLVVVANARKAGIGKDVLDFTVGKVKDMLETGDVVTGKLLLRFLAGLARIVEDDGVLTVIGELVSKIEGEEPNVYPTLIRETRTHCRRGQTI